MCIPKTKSVYPVPVWIHSISRSGRKVLSRVAYTQDTVVSEVQCIKVVAGYTRTTGTDPPPPGPADSVTSSIYVGNVGSVRCSEVQGAGELFPNDIPAVHCSNRTLRSTPTLVEASQSRLTSLHALFRLPVST